MTTPVFVVIDDRIGQRKLGPVEIAALLNEAAAAPDLTLGNTVVGTLKLSSGTKTVAALAGAATLNKDAGVVTTEALVTAAGAVYTLTLTNSEIAAADQVFASVQNGSNTTGMPCVTRVTPGAGSVVIEIQNIAAAAALNGTLKIAFMRLKN